MRSSRMIVAFLILGAAAFCLVGWAPRANLPPSDPLRPQTISGKSSAPATYIGFDRNDYPGEAALPGLRATFAFAGFWLNNPPGENHNSWTGKRSALLRQGFGFLVLFNGRLDAELKRADATALGRADATSATSAAAHEGFPQKTVIFLDIEEGGRMLPEQKSYIFAWIDAVRAAGFGAGVYCSGIPNPDPKDPVVTANDIRQNAAGRPIAFWVANDACPPSPGCAFPHRIPAPSASNVAFADVWQYAQSPRRQQFTAACGRTYAADGNCYAPAAADPSRIFLDIDSAREGDPSHGRSPDSH